MNYSLKSVAKSLHTLGKISTSWDTDDPCADGLTAMVEANHAWKECLSNKIPFKEHQTVKDIIKYNFIDVKVLHEITSYLRTLN
jgi:hypothetical protein